MLKLSEIHKTYCRLIDHYSRFNNFTATVSLQDQAIQEIEEQLTGIRDYKRQAVVAKNEDDANQLLHMQCMLNAMRSSLRVWTLLKSGKYFDAWVNLIDAQEYVSEALKTSDYEGVRKMEEILSQIEGCVFPRQPSYLSSGHVETIGECSICGKKFGLCSHIEGHVYMGSICRRVNKEITELDHVALVENPKDKRCILTHVSEKDGGMRDTFTQEVDTYKSSEEDNEARKVKGIFVSLKSLDL